jgi:hypothetical protein
VWQFRPSSTDDLDHSGALRAVDDRRAGCSGKPQPCEFYILVAIKERWSSRELERQIRSGAVLRDAHGAKKVSSALRQIHPGALNELKNAYNLEFLALADGHSEADLHGALLRHLGRFLTELGRDFVGLAVPGTSRQPRLCGASDGAALRRSRRSEAVRAYFLRSSDPRATPPEFGRLSQLHMAS